MKVSSLFGLATVVTILIVQTAAAADHDNHRDLKVNRHHGKMLRKQQRKETKKFYRQERKYQKKTHGAVSNKNFIVDEDEMKMMKKNGMKMDESILSLKNTDHKMAILMMEEEREAIAMMDSGDTSMDLCKAWTMAFQKVSNKYQRLRKNAKSHKMTPLQKINERLENFEMAEKRRDNLYKVQKSISPQCGPTDDEIAERMEKVAYPRMKKRDEMGKHKESLMRESGVLLPLLV